METTELSTQNLAALYELRTQEKAIKAAIERIKPLAIEEAKLIQPDGGKFAHRATRFDYTLKCCLD